MMASQINDLIRMRDTDTLYELMTEDDDWLTQLDAAGGLFCSGTAAAMNSCSAR
jgi:uncharacterized protein YciI